MNWIENTWKELMITVLHPGQIVDSFMLPCVNFNWQCRLFREPNMMVKKGQCIMYPHGANCYDTFDFLCWEFFHLSWSQLKLSKGIIFMEILLRNVNQKEAVKGECQRSMPLKEAFEWWIWPNVYLWFILQRTNKKTTKKTPNSFFPQLLTM